MIISVSSPNLPLTFFNLFLFLKEYTHLNQWYLIDVSLSLPLFWSTCHEDNPNRFLFYEAYADDDGVTQHKTTAHYKAFDGVLIRS